MKPGSPEWIQHSLSKLEQLEANRDALQSSLTSLADLDDLDDAGDRRSDAAQVHALRELEDQIAALYADLESFAGDDEQDEQDDDVSEDSAFEDSTAQLSPSIAAAIHEEIEDEFSSASTASMPAVALEEPAGVSVASALTESFDHTDPFSAPRTKLVLDNDLALDDDDDDADSMQADDQGDDNFDDQSVDDEDAPQAGERMLADFDDEDPFSARPKLRASEQPTQRYQAASTSKHEPAAAFGSEMTYSDMPIDDSNASGGKGKLWMSLGAAAVLLIGGLAVFAGGGTSTPSDDAVDQAKAAAIAAPPAVIDAMPVPPEPVEAPVAQAPQPQEDADDAVEDSAPVAAQKASKSKSKSRTTKAARKPAKKSTRRPKQKAKVNDGKIHLDGGDTPLG